MIVVAPTTSKVDQFAKGHLNYPRLPQGAGAIPAEGASPGFRGLDQESVVLLDQVRSIDPEDTDRSIKVIGRLEMDAFRQVMTQFIKMMGVTPNK